MQNVYQYKSDHTYIMTPAQKKLFDNIQRFDFDDEDVEFSFSQRLGRENGWSIEFTGRVINEYKKFVFLALVSGHSVTPSDEVDQVWHLHLQYTQSYWKRFCPNVLKMPLHHGPTQGGQLEKNKYNDWYLKTLDSYSRFFGMSPANDIWPAPSIRFGEVLSYQRVNKQRVWIVPKSLVYQILLIIAAVSCIVGF